jgi:hypothetical protein
MACWILQATRPYRLVDALATDGQSAATQVQGGHL